MIEGTLLIIKFFITPAAPLKVKKMEASTAVHYASLIFSH